jgi:hypothetical protein
MDSFTVQVREVHIAFYRVKAPTGEEALAIAANDLNDERIEYVDSGLEFSHHLPSTTWTVEDENGKQVVG